MRPVLARESLDAVLPWHVRFVSQFTLFLAEVKHVAAHWAWELTCRT